MEKKRISNEIKELVEKYAEMEKQLGGSSLVQNLLNQTDCITRIFSFSYLPYNERVMAFPLSQKFNILQMDMYDRSKDLVGHLENFRAHIMLHGYVGEIACRAFPLTLKRIVRGWFGTLRPGSIDSFEELAKQFLT